MQSQHRLLHALLQDQRHDIGSLRDLLMQQPILGCGGTAEYIVGDLVARPWMTDADAQPPESVAHDCDRIPQSVVSAMPTTFFQAQGARRQVEFVVHDQDLAGVNPVEPSDRGDRLTAQIHERGRFQQPELDAAHPNPGELTPVTRLDTERAAMATRQLVTALISEWRALRYPENRAYSMRHNPAAWEALSQMADLSRTDARDRLLTHAPNATDP